MFTKILSSLMIVTAIATNIAPVVAAPKREVNPRLLALAQGKDYCPTINDDDGAYCYKIKAVVDIDSGYLRVWAFDEEDNLYVVGKLYKGELVRIRAVSKYKGRYYAHLSYMRPGCWSVSCAGFVDMAYLR